MSITSVEGSILRTSAERSASHLLRTMLTSALEESPVVSAGALKRTEKLRVTWSIEMLTNGTRRNDQTTCARGLTLNEDVSAGSTHPLGRSRRPSSIRQVLIETHLPVSPDATLGEKLLDVLPFGTVRGFHLEDPRPLTVHGSRCPYHGWDYHGTFGSRRREVGFQS